MKPEPHDPEFEPEKWREPGYRVRWLAESWDNDFLVRGFDVMGLAPGWECLQVGVPATPVIESLANKVGPEGTVTVTVAFPPFPQPPASANVRWVKHRPNFYDLPDESFDLVHARAFLSYASDRDAVLERMAALVRPGGWLVVEDTDFFPVYISSSKAFRQTWKAFEKVSFLQGVFMRWGRKLPGKVAGLGFEDVTAHVGHWMFKGGDKSSEFWRFIWQIHRSALCSVGLISEEDFDEALALMSDPNYWAMTPATVSVLARRPSGFQDPGLT